MKFSLVLLFGGFVSLLFLVLIIFLTFSSVKSGFYKSSPFECGFMSLNSFSVPFSISFFIISLMFLLFDVEILVVSFLPLVNPFFPTGSLFMWLVFVVIMFSTLYEWLKGALSWV